jgi:hypothetical protein
MQRRRVNAWIAMNRSAGRLSGVGSSNADASHLQRAWPLQFAANSCQFKGRVLAWADRLNYQPLN